MNGILVKSLKTLPITWRKTVFLILNILKSIKLFVLKRILFLLFLCTKKSLKLQKVLQGLICLFPTGTQTAVKLKTAKQILTVRLTLQETFSEGRSHAMCLLFKVKCLSWMTSHMQAPAPCPTLPKTWMLIIRTLGINIPFATSSLKFSELFTLPLPGFLG